jgi:hypothetical protein
MHIQRWVNKANDIGIEGTVDREENCHFCKRLDGAQKHSSDNHVAYNLNYISIGLKCSKCNSYQRCRASM